MTGEKGDKTDGLEAYRQEVVLLNGTRMRAGAALAAYEILLDMCETAPQQFQALVAIVKHGAAVADIDRKTRNAMRRAWVILADGSVVADLAAVLDAAYEAPATEDRPILRYPIIHADAAHLTELKKLEREKPERALREIFSPERPGEGRSR